MITGFKPSVNGDASLLYGNGKNFNNTDF